jgi:hypothetical protein
MKRRTFLAASLAVPGLAWLPGRPLAQAGWTTLFDGKNLDNFRQVGDANWRIEDGAAVADKGNGFLVSKESYGDFEMRVEFWADEDANSGVYIRCQNTEKISVESSYEVNIFDKRPEAIYGTGAIVNIAKVDPMPKAAGKWNTFEIIARGPKLTVVFNGQKTADAVEDTRFARGPFALQYAPGVVKEKGVIKFRKVDIRAL